MDFTQKKYLDKTGTEYLISKIGTGILSELPHIVEQFVIRASDTSYTSLLSDLNADALTLGVMYRFDYIAGPNGMAFIVMASSESTIYPQVIKVVAPQNVSSSSWRYKNCNTDAWQVWWDPSPSISKYSWTSPGNGMVYRMIDEWGNDCPYDFKNFKHTGALSTSAETSDGKAYTFNSSKGGTATDLTLTGGAKNNVIKPYYNGAVMTMPNIILSSGGGSNNPGDISDNSFGANCHNILLTSGGGSYDITNVHFGDSCSGIKGTGEFSNINVGDKFTNTLAVTSSSPFNNAPNNWYSLSNAVIGRGCSDVLFTSSNVDGAVIGDKCSSLMFNSTIRNVEIGTRCTSITLGGNSVQNCTFGPGCSSISLTGSCNGSMFYSSSNLSLNGVTHSTFENCNNLSLTNASTSIEKTIVRNCSEISSTAGVQFSSCTLTDCKGMTLSMANNNHTDFYFAGVNYQNAWPDSIVVTVPALSAADNQQGRKKVQISFENGSSTPVIRQWFENSIPNEAITANQITTWLS